MEENSINSKRNGKTSLFFISSIILLGTFLRVFSLGKIGFWGDEIQSASFAQSNISSLLQYIPQTEFSPPLSYLVLHFMSLFGKSEFILRLPFALSGIITIFVIYKLGSLLFSAKEGLVSAFLLAISPFHLLYSRDARMYSLFTLFSLSSYLFFYLAAKNSKWSLWILYSLCITLSLYTHYFTVFVIFSQIIIIFFFTFETAQFFGRSLLRFFLALAFSFLLFLPWIPSLSRQLSINQQFITKVSLSKALLWIINETFIWLGTGTLPGTFFFLLIVAAGILFSIKTCRHQTFLLLSAFFIPIPFTILLVIFRNWLFQPRYILFILPFYLVLTARGICGIGTRLTRIKIKESLSIILLLFIISSLSLFQVKKIFSIEKENWRDTASYISGNMHPKELLIVQPAWGFWALDYYKGLNFTDTSLKDKNRSKSGVWFVKPYNGKPGKDLENITGSPFALKRSFEGWNTINVWYSPSNLKELNLSFSSFHNTNKTENKYDRKFTTDWSWSSSSGKFPKYSFSGNSLKLISESPLKNYLLLSFPIQLSGSDTVINPKSFNGLYCSARIKASNHKIFPGMDLYFYNEKKEDISAVGLKTKGLITGDFTHWGWISEPVNIPGNAFFMKVVFKIPEIKNKDEWVLFDDIKFYGISSSH